MADLQFPDNLPAYVLLSIHAYDLSGQRVSEDSTRRPSCLLTFRAMTTLVLACFTLLTVPPLPAPNSLRTIKSSLRRSSSNSKPISSVSFLLPSRLPGPPGTCDCPSGGSAVLVEVFGRVKFLIFRRLDGWGGVKPDIVLIASFRQTKQPTEPDEKKEGEELLWHKILGASGWVADCDVRLGQGAESRIKQRGC